MSEEKQGLIDWFSERLGLTEIASFFTSFGLLYTELDIRKGLQEALAEALEKPAPSYARWPRVLGLVVVVLLAIVIVSGMLLAFYYLPTPESAHPSVGTILREVNFGWLVREIHHWGAQLLIAVLIIRVVRLFVGGVYRRPRELVWIFAVLLLLVCLWLDLTGRVLPWTMTGYWQGVRALEITEAIPLFGTVVDGLIGVEQTVMGELTLIRVYLLHAAVLPVLALALVYLHFSTVRRVGLSETVESDVGAGTDWFRLHLANIAILFVLALGVLLSLGVLAPTAFEAEADPYHTVPGLGPPWYLLAPFGLLELSSRIPRWIGGSTLAIVFLAILALPFLDQTRSGKRRWWVVGGGIVFLVLWLLLSLYGAGAA